MAVLACTFPSSMQSLLHSVRHVWPGEIQKPVGTLLQVSLVSLLIAVGSLAFMYVSQGCGKYYDMHIFLVCVRPA